MPNQLTVKCSAIPDAGLGVYAKEYIPKGTRCGPYKGAIVDKMDIGADVDTAYMWEVYSIHTLYYLHTYCILAEGYTHKVEQSHAYTQPSCDILPHFIE